MERIVVTESGVKVRIIGEPDLDKVKKAAVELLKRTGGKNE